MIPLLTALAIPPKLFPGQYVRGPDGRLEVDVESLADLERDPVARPNATTTAWAKAHLSTAAFATSPTDLDSFVPYRKFLIKVAKYTVPAYPNASNIDCWRPQSEEDICVAIDRQVIAPTMQAMYEAKTVDGASFLPTGQEFKQTSVLELKVYVLSEAYTKHGFQPLEEFNSDLVTVTAPENDEAEVVRVAQAGPPTTTGVRLDKLIVIAVTGKNRSAVTDLSKKIHQTRNAVSKAMKRLRSPASTLNSEPSPVFDHGPITSNSGNLYLRENEAWGLVLRETVAGPVYPAELTYNKALGCLELKRAGNLKNIVQDLKSLTNASSTFIGTTLTNPDQIKGRVAGTVSILQQAIRYAAYYGTRYVILSDYTSDEALLLVVPEIYVSIRFKDEELGTNPDEASEGASEEAHEKPKQGPNQEIIWIPFHRERIKQVFAFVASSSLDAMAELYEKDEILEAKRREKEKKPSKSAKGKRGRGAKGVR